jgi:hypothetical protein
MASDIFVLTLWNTLSAPSSDISTIYEDGTECSKLLEYKIWMLGKHPRERILQTHHFYKIFMVDWTHQFITLSPTSKNVSGLHHRGIKVMTLFSEWKKRRPQTVWYPVPKWHCWQTKKYIIIFIYCKNLKFYITYPLCPFWPPNSLLHLVWIMKSTMLSAILYISHTLQCIILHCHGHLFSWLMCSSVKERFIRLLVTWLQVTWLLVTWLQDSFTHSYSFIQHSRDPPQWI